jgi:hypothetical protein
VRDTHNLSSANWLNAGVPLRHLSQLTYEENLVRRIRFVECPDLRAPRIGHERLLLVSSPDAALTRWTRPNDRSALEIGLDFSFAHATKLTSVSQRDFALTVSLANPMSAVLLSGRGPGTRAHFACRAPTQCQLPPTPRRRQRKPC